MRLKPTKWRHPSCPNSWLWNGISREPFGALRSVMARLFAFFTLFHMSLTFFDRRCPLIVQMWPSWYCTLFLCALQMWPSCYCTLFVLTLYIVSSYCRCVPSGTWHPLHADVTLLALHTFFRHPAHPLFVLQMWPTGTRHFLSSYCRCDPPDTAQCLLTPQTPSVYCICEKTGL